MVEYKIKLFLKNYCVNPSETLDIAYYLPYYKDAGISTSPST